MPVLNLSGPTLDGALEPPAPPRPKRAWLAFVLSLLVAFRAFQANLHFGR
jgi:hypothetical protein